MARIFVSFQEQQAKWAEWIAWYLEKNQGHQVYQYKLHSRVGEDKDERIEAEIKQCDLFLPIFSEAYFESPECRRELAAANQRDMRTKRSTIRAVLVDQFEIPYIHTDKVYIDLIDARTPEEVGRRLQRLDGEAGPPGAPPEFPLADPDAAPAPEPSAAPIEIAEIPPDPGDPVFPNSVKKITPTFDEFIKLLRIEEGRSPVSQEKYSPYDQKTGRDKKRRERHASKLLREPNFLLFERAGTIVMAIVDKRRSVIDTSLQLTTEWPARARPIKRSQFADLGFDTSFIHPMFADGQGAISRIIIDSALFFQFLYFPNSSVKLPCLKEPGYVITTASAFVRVMLSQHGGDKVHFATIARRGWPDDILLEGLTATNCFTRFAPTPNSGLHLGHVRTSLIAYLMYRSDPQKNLFHLRFDDTNAGDPESKDQIRRELSWLGYRIEADRIFSQTDQNRQCIYDEVFELLKAAGYTKRLPDGVWTVDPDHPDLKFAHWMDMHKGPQILHGIPPAWDAKQEKFADVDLTIKHEDGRFKYKFTGAVDDLLLSTHVFRDIRQEHLTARQALIRYAIYRAHHVRPATDRIKTAKATIESFWRTSIGQARSQPLPFLAPPVYAHVANVLGEDGEILSTRVLIQKAQKGDVTPILLADCQKRRLLPETVVSYLLGTIFHPTMSEDVIRLCATHGVETAIDLLASKIDLGWLLSSRKPVRIAYGWPCAQEKPVRIAYRWSCAQEKKVIRAMSIPVFRLRIASYCRSQGVTLPNNQILYRMYDLRKYFRSWIEVLQLATGGKALKGNQKLLLLYANVVRNLDDAATSATFKAHFTNALAGEMEFPAACKRVRKALFGTESGPGILAIGRMLGSKEIERRAGLS